MIIIKNEKEIEIMRQGGKILAGILKKIIAEVKPGVTTGSLEQIACDLIKTSGGRPAFKGYKSMHEAKAFPTALCVSINHELVHAPALPSRKLNSSDIVSLDLGMEHPFEQANIHGYYTDIAVTVAVGKVSKQVEKLISITKKSLALAINQVKPGNSLNDIGRAIQQFVEAKGLSVVRDLVGHGVGTAVHEEPQVPNYEVVEKNFNNIILRPGMTIAIEPMVNIGNYKVKSGKDGFTIATADNSLSAHFEHTVAVTKNGHEVLTKL